MKKEIFIVAGGPSLTDFDWSYLDDKNVLVINRSYEKCPNANYLYWTDERFWEMNSEGLLAHSAPHKIAAFRKPSHANYPPEIERYRFSGLKGYDKREGYLRTGNNSGHAALSLAIQLGYRSIYLLGYDLRFIQGKSHWHEGHFCPRKGVKIDNLESTLTDKMLPFFGDLKEAVSHIPNLTIINTNRNSAIKCFDFGDLP